jgi:thiamine kinase-like enzyme
LSSVLDEARALIERLGLAGLSAPLRAARTAIEAAHRPARALHGDAHSGNLLRTPEGLLWTDFEDACSAPLEWDLACLVAGSDDPQAALGAYGYEGGEAALAPFVEARRLQVASWTALMAEHHPQLRGRAQERLRRWAT